MLVLDAMIATKTRPVLQVALSLSSASSSTTSLVISQTQYDSMCPTCNVNVET